MPDLPTYERAGMPVPASPAPAGDASHLSAGQARGRERGENFPVALRVLPARYRHRLHAVYRYARYVDDLGDEARGDRRAGLSAVRAEVDRLYRGERVEDPVVAGLRPTVEQCGLPRDPLLRLVQANLQDQDVTRYQTFDGLLDYCRLSADPVGEIVLYVFGQVTDDRIMLSNRICTGLQLVEHWQDIAEDRRAGRVYLPQEDLRRFGVAEQELDKDSAAPPLRALVAFETERAAALLESGAALVPAMRGWGRLAVSGYLAGGRAAVAALARAGHDPLPGPPKPRRHHVAACWLAAGLGVTR